jgi:hypothetical protein
LLDETLGDAVPVSLVSRYFLSHAGSPSCPCSIHSLSV